MLGEAEQKSRAQKVVAMSYLSIIAKTICSNLFLLNWRRSASFKKGRFDALSTEAGAASATSRRFSNFCWLRDVDSNHD
jgi:hypothetical protein